MKELGLTPKSGFSSIIKVVLEGLTTEKARGRWTTGQQGRL